MDVRTAKNQIIIDRLHMQMALSAEQFTYLAGTTSVTADKMKDLGGQIMQFQRVPPGVGPFKGGC